MNRRSYLTVLVSLLTLGLAASVLANWQHAEKTDMQRTAKTDFMLFDSMDLLGSPVKDENGDVFGIVSDLKIDSRGKAIAIINHGDYDRFGDSGRFTPVPFDALEVSEDGWGKASVALKVDEKQLEAAPFFDPTKSSDGP